MARGAVGLGPGASAASGLASCWSQKLTPLSLSWRKPVRIGFLSLATEMRTFFSPSSWNVLPSLLPCHQQYSSYHQEVTSTAVTGTISTFISTCVTSASNNSIIVTVNPSTAGATIAPMRDAALPLLHPPSVNLSPASGALSQPKPGPTVDPLEEREHRSLQRRWGLPAAVGPAAQRSVIHSLTSAFVS